MATPFLRRFLVAAALLAALCAAVARPAGAAGPAPSATTGALRICSDCVQTGGNLARYGYVVLNSWDAGLIGGLKAANPGVKVLEYKNLSFTVDYTCSGGLDNTSLPAGVGYCAAVKSHPEWFLRDTAGQRIASAGFGSSWLMDVGDAGYQSAWLASVSAEAKAGGWDGVFVDDVNADMGWHLNGRTIAKYPTSAAWQSATRSMLAKVGPALQAQGTLFVPNISAPWLPSYDALALWKDWLQFTSGAAQEFYSKWGNGSSGWFTGSDWTFRQQFQIATEQAGKIFLGLTYAPHADSRSQVWARANFLLNTTGGRSALIFENGDQEAGDPYADSWTADIGAPAGARYQVGSAWRREFTGGTVVVNPSNATATVQLGKSYRTAAGATVSAVTLAPATGAVLASTGDAVPAPKIGLRATRVAGGVQLTWSAATAKDVDVVRNGVAVKTTRNDGSYLDQIDRKATGTFTYKVCLAGTKTCSAAVSVTVGTKAPAGRKLAAHKRAKHGKRG